ncbi:MAG: MATE family efflux transporter [Chloroflexota bacterium]
MSAIPHDHPFIHKPHRTVLALSVPVFLSLVAEPLTGLIDTAFVARLGAVALAALGVGTIALSSVFWIFNFLAIGTQTEVAQASGSSAEERAARINGLALAMSGLFGLLVIVVGWPAAPWAATALGATGDIHTQALLYMRIRLFGAPAIIASLTAFGALRGLQDMRTPLWIAVTVNALNILLDWLFITGVGPFPAWGIGGAAVASVFAQWIGGIWAVTAVLRQFGWPSKLRLHEAGRLLQIGGDLFLRTGSLTLFLLLATRVATRIGAESGAAHQAIRQVWTFTALGLDALAVTGQSLVGYFMGSAQVAQARRVAWVSCIWGVLMGVLLGAVMVLGQSWVIRGLVPETAVAVFVPAWLVAAVVQPINALAFVTDGLHWGTGDYRYLRNVVFLATLTGGIGLWLVEETAVNALTWVWVASGAWISVRALFGVLRIWPGIGQSPFTVKQ